MKDRNPYFRWPIALCVPLVFFAGCDESRPPVPPPSESASPLSTDGLPPDAALIPYALPLEHIGVGDLDGDGRADVALVSHVSSRADVFLQQPDRQFSHGAALDDVGFHPNGTLFITDANNQRYFLLNAETTNSVKVYRAASGGRLKPFGALPSPSPTFSALANWPGVGPTFAVAQKGGGDIRIFKGLDPAHPELAEPVVAKATPRPTRRVMDLVAADLRGDGSASFVATVPQEGLVVRLSRADDDTVAVHEVWSTDRRAAADLSLPVDFDGDGDEDLFLLGQSLNRVVLLLGDGAGGFTERSFPLSSPGAQSGAVITESDGSLMLWAAFKRTVTVLRWSADGRDRDPTEKVFERVGRDWIRFASSDLDNDGHDDLILGSSVGFIPPAVLYGPLYPNLDAVVAWLEGSSDENPTSPEPAPRTPTGG